MPEPGRLHSIPLHESKWIQMHTPFCAIPRWRTPFKLLTHALRHASIDGTMKFIEEKRHTEKYEQKRSANWQAQPSPDSLTPMTTCLQWLTNHHIQTKRSPLGTNGAHIFHNVRLGRLTTALKNQIVGRQPHPTNNTFSGPQLRQ